MAQSLRKVGSKIKDLSSFPDFEVNLNLESLLTLDVENQHENENLREWHHGEHIITGIPTHITLLNRLLPLASWSLLEFPNRSEKDCLEMMK